MSYLAVKVKPSAREDKIEALSNTSYKVWVTAKAEKGKANQAVIKLLAKHLKVKKSQLRFVAGLKSREKVIELT